MQSIFKLGQNIGQSIIESSLKVFVLEKDEGEIKYYFEDNIVILKSKFGTIKIFKGFLDSAECYQFIKIKDKIEGKFKKEILTMISDHESNCPRRLGYKVIDDIMIIFINSSSLLFRAYKISTNYD